MTVRIVQHTAELDRVSRMARRKLAADPAFTQRLSEALRHPGSSATLLPTQAEALYEAAQCDGLFGAIGVGGGKTLISLLAPTVMGARRPLLLIPGKLRVKTEREMRALMRDWRISKHIRIESYERMARENAAETILRYRPDVIVLDEAHKAKNRQAAVTRRLGRYLATDHACKLVALSGTITKRSLRDYAHILLWTHRHYGPPITRVFLEIVDWADAIDEKPSSWFAGVCDPGALLSLASPEDVLAARGSAVTAARLGYSRRLTETPGVISTHLADVDASLTVSVVDLPGTTAPVISEAFKVLRNDWALPNGQECIDGIELYRHARELALGFYYVWDPSPPVEWREARKAWAKLVRQVLAHNRHDLDTAAQVERAIREGYGGNAAMTTLAAWKRVEPIYTVHTVPVWLDDRMLRYAAHWLATEHGVCWVEHLAFGAELSRLTGLPFYAGGGRCLTDKRLNIEDAKGPIIASIPANSEGRNLQRYHKSLVISPPRAGLGWEQLLGRMHRRGQEADEVTYTVPVSCIEHVTALLQAQRDARYIQHTTRTVQKLTYCTIDMDDLDAWATRPGPEWWCELDE